MNALGYIRRSAKSDSHVVSLDAQREAIFDYCKRRGFVVADIVAHDGISGGKRGRFATIEAKRIAADAEAIVVYNLDRFARDSAGMLDYISTLTKRGIQLHETTSGVIDYRRAQSRLMVAVRGAMDEFYKDVIGEKTADALNYLRGQGLQYTNIPPLGWVYVDGRMVKEQEEQRALAIIAECRAAGFGRLRTLRSLRAAGYNGRGSSATIQKLLKGGVTSLHSDERRITWKL